MHAGAASEIKKRAVNIPENESHFFCPVMEKCLKEKPQSRGTFEEVIVHLNKYSKRKLNEVNMHEVK